jgi:methylthioribose-1-phosphate isomerase
MKVNGTHYRSIWLDPNDHMIVQIIDQRLLPHEFIIHELKTWQDGAVAIKDMYVRGAPLIGATAAWSMYLASLTTTDQAALKDIGEQLLETRPTAVNLRWGVERMLATNPANYRAEAEAICDEDVEISKGMGRHGLELIKEISTKKKGAPVNILTHCNAGWLATVDWGTATAPMYTAHEAGIPIHVWVDETRPRNQGAHITAFELGQHGIPHTVIVDNTGGHLMQHGLVDMCLVGTDRTTRCGDVANKIGTYLKALAANDNNVPFYVALPSTTIDWTIRAGVSEIPIEQRDAEEVTHVRGKDERGIHSVQITPDDSPAANYAFDVTPARLVTGLITERGVCEASEEGLLGLFPEDLRFETKT